MSLPGDITPVTVTGDGMFIGPDGEAQSGWVTFDPGGPVKDATGHVIISGTVRAPVYAGTMRAVELVPTGLDGLTPFTYAITVNTGGKPEKFTGCTLPTSLAPSTTLDVIINPAPVPTVTAFNSPNTWTQPQTFTGTPPMVVPHGTAGEVLTADAGGNVTLRPPPAAAVASVNGQTGAVVLDASDVGADPSGAADAAQSAAEAASVPLSALPLPVTSGGTGAATASAARAALGLGTAAVQPSSAFDAAGTASSLTAAEASARSAADALLAPLASPALTGTPTAPTRSAGDASTKLATTAYADTAVAAETTRAETAEALAVPASQVFTLANNAFRTILSWQVTGQTDVTAPFSLITGSQTYSHAGGTAIQGPAGWFGYNTRKLTAQAGLTPAESSNGALGMACFADAGDTNNGAGGHGLEFSIGTFLSPDGSKGTNAVEVVAVNDNTNTVTLSLRCGSGSLSEVDGSFAGSQVSITDMAGNSYLTAGPFNNQAYNGNAASTRPAVFMNGPFSFSNAAYFYVNAAAGGTATWQWANNNAVSGTNANIAWSVASGFGNLTANWLADAGTFTGNFFGGTAATMTLETLTSGNPTLNVTAAGSGTAILSLNGNTTTAGRGEVVFGTAGTPQWTLLNNAGSSFYVLNNSGNGHILLVSGVNSAGNYNAAVTYLLTKTYSYGSLICNNGGSALAAPATDGYFYVPVSASAPTGVPTAQAGSAAVTYSGGRLWIYDSGWKAVTVS